MGSRREGGHFISLILEPYWYVLAVFNDWSSQSNNTLRIAMIKCQWGDFSSFIFCGVYINALAQDFSNSSVLAMELLQFGTTSLILFEILGINAKDKPMLLVSPVRSIIIFFLNYSPKDIPKLTHRSSYQGGVSI